MNESPQKWIALDWFPNRRFEPDFPLVYWYVGLWLYLKSFLYVCYLYMIGLDPPPYPSAVQLEMVYFGVTFLPAFFIGLALWHEKHWAVFPAVIFFVLDSPLLIFHVLRLSADGHLDAGLTKFLEFGGLILNVIALGWLSVHIAGQRNKKS